MEYILSMTFTTEGGKNTTLSISGVKNDVDEADKLGNSATVSDIVILDEADAWEVSTAKPLDLGSAV